MPLPAHLYPGLPPGNQSYGGGGSWMKTMDTFVKGHQLGRLIRHEIDRPDDEEMKELIQRLDTDKATLDDYIRIEKYQPGTLQVRAQYKQNERAAAQEMATQEKQRALMAATSKLYDSMSKEEDLDEQFFLDVATHDMGPEVKEIAQLWNGLQEARRAKDVRTLEQIEGWGREAGRWATAVADMAIQTPDPARRKEIVRESLINLKGLNPEGFQQLVDMNPAYEDLDNPPSDLLSLNRLKIVGMGLMGMSEKAGTALAEVPAAAMQAAHLGAGDPAGAAGIARTGLPPSVVVEDPVTGQKTYMGEQVGGGIMGRDEYNRFVTGRGQAPQREQAPAGPEVTPSGDTMRKLRERSEIFYGETEQETPQPQGARQAPPEPAAGQAMREYWSQVGESIKSDTQPVSRMLRQRKGEERVQGVKDVLRREYFPDHVEDRVVEMVAKKIISAVDYQKAKTTEEIDSVIKQVLQKFVDSATKE